MEVKRVDKPPHGSQQLFLGPTWMRRICLGSGITTEPGQWVLADLPALGWTYVMHQWDL
jgi:hypothetical protein